MEVMGADHMLFSADYPFEKMEDAANWFDRVPMSDAQRIQVGRTNAIQLFKLDLK
jgi:2,3-dihydroxybenzoate decarboxylase